MNHPQAEQVKSGSAIGIVNNEALQKLNQEGAELGEQVVAALSPYVRQHINRFGRYQLDLTQPPPLNYDIRVITSKRKSAGSVASEAQKKAKSKQKKKKSARQMKLFS